MATGKRQIWDCQFCGKEMRFWESVVEVEKYYTCGAEKCVRQAHEHAAALRKEQTDKLLHREVSAIVLKSKNRLDVNSWEPVPPDEIPEFMSRPVKVCKACLQPECANGFNQCQRPGETTTIETILFLIDNPDRCAGEYELAEWNYRAVRTADAVRFAQQYIMKQKMGG